MPRDEIGMIKEGPAIRYLNGQALWDKKYKHALKSIRRHRDKNLRNAKERDSGKIRGMWQKRIDKERLEREHRKESGGSKVSGRARTLDEDEPGWETEAASDVEDDGEHGEAEKSLTDELVDQSWSWSWAWGGEVPPPSAIVSRRDFVRGLSRRSQTQALMTRRRRGKWLSWRTAWTGRMARSSTDCPYGSA